MSDETPCYIGRIPACGCVVAVVVDEPEHAKSTAKDVAGFIRDGLAVERMTVDEARAALKFCDHQLAAAPKKARRR